MGANYSNLAKAIDQTYCDFCKKLTNHKTNEHECSKCREIGDHSSSKHLLCNFCIEHSHLTKNHICSECGKNHSIHIHKNQLCIYCGGDHDKKYHRCSICDDFGHEKSYEEHKQCFVCEEPIKFTHNLKNHTSLDNQGFFKYIDIGKLSKKDVISFRHCNNCQKIVYIDEEQKCCNCGLETPENIECKKIFNGCGYICSNQLMNYCPICGNKLNIYPK